MIEGVPYVLAMTFNALIALQQLFERDGALPTVEAVLQRAFMGDLEAFRAVFWATLQRHHADVTIEKAGDLIDAAGGIMALDEMLQKVQKASGPDPEDTKALRGGAARPPRATTATKTRR